MIKRIPALAALLLLTTALSAFFVLVVSRADFIENLRLKSIDSLFAMRSSLSPASPSLAQIVIVGVDDESFTRMKRSWPWSRDVFAFFLEKLTAASPRVVAFDFVFSGSGPNPKADAWWAKTIAQSGNTILASYYGAENTLVLPHPQIAGAALALGLVDKPQDVDGSNRKTRAFVEEKNRTMFSLAIEAYYRGMGADPAHYLRAFPGRLEYAEPEMPDASASGRTVAAQTDREGKIWLSYRYRPERFAYVPFWRILQGGEELARLKGKTVLAGPVSPVFHDIHATPIGRMPGVFAMANELAALMDRDFVREPFADTEALFTVLLGVLFTLAIYRFAFGIQLAGYIGISVIFYGLCAILFCRAGWLIDPFYPIVVFTLNFISVASWKALKTFLDNIALQRQVITDSLTGLYGHRFLTLKLGSIFLHAMQNKQEFCVAMLDADHFKKVNDTYGHDVGNQVLIGITKVMKQHVRRQDIAARFGGEEFSVVLIGTDTKGARECLERMRKAIEDLEFHSDKGKFKVTISSGLVSNQNPAVKTSDDMLKLADKALYQAKQEGRNRVCTA